MGDPLPNGSNTGRYCAPKCLSEKGEILAAAFALRKGEPDLSVYWLEHYGAGSESQNVDALKKELPSAVIPAKTSLIGVVGADEAKRAVSNELSITLRFEYTPTISLGSHSSIMGIDYEDMLSIANILAEIANDRTSYPAAT
jgi:hypothetical protein